MTINPGSHTSTFWMAWEAAVRQPVYIPTAEPAQVVRVADSTTTGPRMSPCLRQDTVSIYLGNGQGASASVQPSTPASTQPG